DGSAGMSSAAQDRCRPVVWNEEMILNDIHSRLNPTTPAALVRPGDEAGVRAAIGRAAYERLPVAVCGGRHSMGGQQFVDGGLQIDTGALDQLRDLDTEAGTVTVGAGLQWPGLLSGLLARQDRTGPAPTTGAAPLGWTFRQKQTGADRLSIGGAVSSNIHGRGLALPPFVADVESLTLVDADGEVRTCNRTENPRLFALSAGGYGLFGVLTDVTVRLTPRRRVRRVVEVTTLDAGLDALRRGPDDGFEYGDFQFAIDPAADGFLHDGVLSRYRPVADDTPLTSGPIALDRASWEQLLHLAHHDKGGAFDAYSRHYLSTDGQVYWGDEAQFGIYVDGYHEALDQAAGEMITEVYVPRHRLLDFMSDCADDFRRHGTDVIYGTIRMIEQDTESFLPWARGAWACVIVNLHVRHDEDGLTAARRDFRGIIDRALERGGSFYLTYHRWATKEQVMTGHPRIVDFLRAKIEHDPRERFQSEWYRHLRAMFAAELDLDVPHPRPRS
ncbi:MAG: FAD-binding oxidoreductase, partial [Nocardioides sp.]